MNGADMMADAARQIEGHASGPKPSVGRIVHYRCPAEAHRWHLAGQPEKAQPIAAIITEVVDHDWVSLTVFQPGREPKALNGRVRRGTAIDTWSFPERV